MPIPTVNFFRFPVLENAKIEFHEEGDEQEGKIKGQNTIFQDKKKQPDAKIGLQSRDSLHAQNNPIQRRQNKTLAALL